ncbi:MAG: PP2C family protein-serine/threonine phosphatase, partial [Anaerolineae bacterium]
GTPSLFVTVLYGVLDTASGQFRYARAGHELPLIGVDGDEAQLAPMDIGQPLGMLDEPAIDEGQVLIPPGGGLLLYSDGFADAQNPEGIKFGRERLLESFARVVSHPAQELCDRLWQVLQEYQGAGEQFDDVTLVSVRSTAGES